VTRLRSDFWVSAYIRRCAVAGIAAVLVRRGAAEAGAIFIDLDWLDGTRTLFAPAPQSELPGDVERYWVRAHKDERIDALATQTRVAREITFDPDLWLIAVESRAGLHFLDLITDT